MKKEEMKIGRSYYLKNGRIGFYHGNSIMGEAVFNTSQRDEWIRCEYDEVIGETTNDWKLSHLRVQLGEMETILNQIVVTAGVDKGVVMLSSESPTRPSIDRETGQPCRVYVHEYFSPLGDALIELHELLLLTASGAIFIDMPGEDCDCKAPPGYLRKTAIKGL